MQAEARLLLTLFTFDSFSSFDRDVVAVAPSVEGPWVWLLGSLVVFLASLITIEASTTF